MRDVFGSWIHNINVYCIKISLLWSRQSASPGPYEHTTIHNWCTMFVDSIFKWENSFTLIHEIINMKSNSSQDMSCFNIFIMIKGLFHIKIACFSVIVNTRYLMMWLCLCTLYHGSVCHGDPQTRKLACPQYHNSAAL